MKFLLPALFLIAAIPAMAQLPDPTRPAGATEGGGAIAGGAAESGVQAVFLRQGSKPAALINGEYVVEGGKLGERRVLKITETAVVLRDAAGNREVMKVIADAEKRPVADKAAGKKKTGGSADRRAADEGARKQ